MPFYKDLDNNVHYLEDAAHAHILPSGALEITGDEADALRPVPTASELIKAQIDSLESEITPRRMREALLGGDEWLKLQEQKIDALRRKR